MPEMPSLENDVYLSPPAMPTANPQAFGRADEAFAQAMREMSAESAEFNQRLVEARRVTNASNTMASLGNNLADLEHKWSLVPDRTQALAGFQNDVQALRKQAIGAINDPLQQEIVSRQFNEEAIARADSVGKNAFARESETHVGALDQNLLTFSQQAASAPNDAARDVITRNAKASIAAAASAGWLNPADAASRGINFASTVQEQRIRNLANEAYDARDGAALDRLAETVTHHPDEFPGLVPERGAALVGEIESKAYRMDMHNAQAQAHADMVAQRNFARMQAHNEAVLLAQTLDGKAQTPAQLEALANAQQISAGGVEALSMAREREEKGHDDPMTAVHMWDAAGKGELDTSHVYGALQAGTLSTQTAVDLVRTIDAKSDKGDNAEDRANFNTLKQFLGGGRVEAGTIIGDARQAEIQWGQAQGEFNRRVVIGGEDSSAVLADMTARLKPEALSQRWLPQTHWGAPQSSNDVQAIAQKLADGYRAGKIPQSDFIDQADVLNGWKRYWALRDEAAHAAALAKQPGRGRPPGSGGAENVGMSPQ